MSPTQMPSSHNEAHASAHRWVQAKVLGRNVGLQLKRGSRYHLLGAFVLALLTACQQTVSSSSPARDLSGSLGGAEYAIRVPANWNGTMLLFSHGTILPLQSACQGRGAARCGRSRRWP